MPEPHNPIVPLGWTLDPRLDLLAEPRSHVGAVVKGTPSHRKASSNETRATTSHYEGTETKHQEYPPSWYTASLSMLFKSSCAPRLEQKRTEDGKRWSITLVAGRNQNACFLIQISS